jgi:hypothetical protein
MDNPWLITEVAMSAKDFLVHRSGDIGKTVDIEDASPEDVLVGFGFVCDRLLDWITEKQETLGNSRTSKHYLSSIKMHLYLVSLSLKFLVDAYLKGEKDGKRKGNHTT